MPLGNTWIGLTFSTGLFALLLYGLLYAFVICLQYHTFFLTFLVFANFFPNYCRCILEQNIVYSSSQHGVDSSLRNLKIFDLSVIWDIWTREYVYGSSYK